MGCRSRDEQRDIKLSLSRLTCGGHRSGDLTSCWDWSCQGKEQGFEMRKEIDYACVCVCLHKKRAAEALCFWNLSFIPPSLSVVVLSPLWRVFLQQGKLRHCLDHLSLFCGVTSVCSLYSGSADFHVWKYILEICFRLDFHKRITNTLLTTPFSTVWTRVGATPKGANIKREAWPLCAL